MSKDGTLHLTYWREYYDDEDMDWFPIHHTIFRNVPLSRLQRLNSKELKAKVKAFCDKNYKETADNFTGTSGVDMIPGSEYYRTYCLVTLKHCTYFRTVRPKYCIGLVYLIPSWLVWSG